MFKGFENVRDLGYGSFVYALVNISTSRKYVGGTQDIKRRVQIHHSQLKNGKHWNKELQNDFLKYGVANFEVVVLCQVKKNQWVDYVEIDYIRAEENPYNMQKKKLKQAA